MKISFLISRTTGRLTAPAAVLGENMKMLTKKIAILSALLLLPLLASAAPSYINYQGRLVDTTGNPLAGDVIPGVDGLRKVRWGRAGMGKRGGARVIYFNRLPSGEVVLVAIYAKAKFDNLPPAVLKMWKDAYDA